MHYNQYGDNDVYRGNPQMSPGFMAMGTGVAGAIGGMGVYTYSGTSVSFQGRI